MKKSMIDIESIFDQIAVNKHLFTADSDLAVYGSSVIEISEEGIKEIDCKDIYKKEDSNDTQSKSST
jgi:hypothetical protein